MKEFVSIAFFVSVLVTLSAGARPAEAATLTTLYQVPQAVEGIRALVRAPSGNFFGLTLSGGDPTNCNGGCGAAFMLTPSGNAYTETTIYAWPYGPVDPDGLLLDKDGTLYGTTYQGAVGINGSVFKLVPAKNGFAQSTIFQFDGSNGSAPYGLLQGPNGTLIGTIGRGQDGNAFGAHFMLTPTRSGYKRTIIYAFKLRKVGAEPSALTAGPAGTFFGSTALGGGQDLGIVYELTPGQSGYVETTLLTFDFTNGEGPASQLTIDQAGNLFGTAGGGHCLGGSMCYSSTGVAFELSPSKNGYVETLLHVFAKNEAYGPSSGLVPFGGAFYGTTGGGAKSYKYGTIYKLVKSGSGYRETILHAFTGKDGIGPSDLFLGQDNALYGDTYSGGALGGGTVFKFVP